MPRIVKPKADSPEYTATYGKTLATVAAEECESWVTWQAIAQLNWGTSEPAEVVRALAETVGIRIDGVFDKWGALKAKPQDVRFDPQKDLPKSFRLPVSAPEVKLDMRRRHEIRVKRSKPPVAVAIRKLDPWFIPEIEECDVAYAWEGLAENADKSRLEIYGSNYTTCTDYAKGVGKYVEDTAPFDTIALFKEAAAAAPKERGAGSFKWKGEVTATEGLLKHKRAGQEKRHVNVAFSPYTALMRYWKAEGDEKAHLQLMPFWPQFENTDKIVALTPTYKPSQPAATSIEFAYTNADATEGGWLSVVDAQGQVVWRRALEDDELKKGARKIEWDGAYNKLALNGVMKPELINDSAKSDDQIRTEGFLFRSWPYVFELKTYTRTYKTGGDAAKDPSLIKWKLRDAKNLARGLIQVFDKEGALVWMNGLPKAKLASGAEQSIKWDGKYAAGVKNSAKGDKAIEADMPYRVQIQVHTPENTDAGLALAAMHSEVRLYVPQGQYAAEDPRRDLIETPAAMQLTQAKYWPKPAPPTSGQTELYYQYALTKAGFHPGPLSGADNNHLKRAIREFKRSVPKSVTAEAGAFERHSLDGGVIDTMTADMTECLGAPDLNPRWTRKIWGDRAMIDANSHTPYPSDDEVDKRLGDPEKALVLWVDDRQYYTDGSGPFGSFGPQGVDFLGNPAGGVASPAGSVEKMRDRGLRNYRGGMSIGDGSVAHDHSEISQPWAPLRAELRLLGKVDPLHPKAKDAFVKIDDDDRRAAMRRAIGPLRVDWSVHDALYDVSTMDPANYPMSGPMGASEIRTRRFVAGALHAAKRRHKRKDEAFHENLWNCRKNPHDVGKQPDDMRKYHREVFAQGDDDSLRPWAALHDDDAEATATFIHDHVAELKDGDKNQKADETLFEPEIGAAGIWFNPAIAAGDGYRLRAEVKFKEVGDYKFPNLKVLAARYPIAPQANSCEIRMWRRSTFRGYAKWSPAGTASRWTDATVNQIRKQYAMGHVYFTQDGADNMAALQKDVAAMFNNFGAAEQTILRNFVTWSNANNWIADVNQATAHQDYSWPWHVRPDLGRPNGEWATDAASYADEQNTYLEAWDGQWDKLTALILYWINERFEADGRMCGHMMVDFKDAPRTKLWKYTCPTNPDHIYMKLMRHDAADPHGAFQCPICPPISPSPMNVTSTNYDGVFLAAIGLAVGSSWLFPGGGDLWAHEIGHHKHLEHASSAPGAQTTQHDSVRNPNVLGATAEIEGQTNVDELAWDRRCLMSYNDSDGGSLLFCGKCVMRNRGWKYGSVPNLTGDVNEPA
jgi:hypothetical protein